MKRRRARKPDRFSRSTKRVQRTACTPGSWMGCQRLSVKKQPQGRDEDVVDLIFRVYGTGAGDDVVAPGQRLGPDELEKQAGDGAVVVMEDHIPVASACTVPR